MTTPSRDNLLRMDGWPGGVNNRMREYEQSTQRGGETIESSAFLRRALNVDLTAEGHPLRRPGYTQITPGFAHSAYYSRNVKRYFVVQDGVFYGGETPTTLLPLMPANSYRRMSYAEYDGSVFFTNGGDSARYDVDLFSNNGGINAWPNNALVPEDANKNADFEGGEGRFLNVDDVAHVHRVLPRGQHVTAHRGRIWTAGGRDIFYSHPLMVDYHRPATEFLLMPHPVQMMESIDDGVYIGDAEGIRFIRTVDPEEEAEQLFVYDHGVVPWAFARLPGEKFGVNLEEVLVFWTKDGVMHLGLPGGEVRPLTRDRLAVPEFSSGAVSLREREGISQVVSTLQKGGDENNMGATDTVVAEIRRADC